MRKRRGRDEGSIFQRQDGLWVATVSLGYDAQGQRIRKTVYGKTKTEVREKLLAIQQDTLSGLPVKAENLTLDQHFQDWFRAKAASVRETTVVNYRYVYNANVKPHLGHVKLKDLDYRRLNALYEKLREKGLTRSISLISFLLRSALEDAVKKGLVPNNQGKLAASFREEEKEARFLNQKEVAAFIKACKGERLGNGFVLALYTGLRPGEWLGLTWEAVDMQNGKVTVTQALHENAGKVWLGEVKTSAGKRTVSLSDVAALLAQKEKQQEEFLLNPTVWRNENNLIFTNTTGGLLRRTNVLKRDFQRVLFGMAKELLGRALPEKCSREEAIKKAGLEDITLHSLRHTHASILIFQGVDIKTVSARLGHKDVAFTLQVYGHLLPGQDEKAAAAMDNFCKSL